MLRVEDTMISVLLAAQVLTGSIAWTGPKLSAADAAAVLAASGGAGNWTPDGSRGAGQAIVLPGGAGPLQPYPVTPSNIAPDYSGKQLFRRSSLTIDPPLHVEPYAITPRNSTPRLDKPSTIRPNVIVPIVIDMNRPGMRARQPITQPIVTMPRVIQPIVPTVNPASIGVTPIR